MRLLLLAAAVFAAAAQTPSIHLENGNFIVKGAQPGPEPEGGWSSVFRVFTGTDESQPMLGDYVLNGESLVFQPRFPAAGNVTWRAVFHPRNGPPVTAIFSPPPQAEPSARVEHIYPSSSVLPGNVLRLYVAFSAPMSRGEAWKRIHLLDEAGKPIDLAFLEIEQELWDRGNRRLTVLFDPGRIKRGLVPAGELGTPIVEGRRYTLLIDAAWHDANGIPMAGSFRKEFRGGPVDRATPHPGLWRITAPQAGTVQPLVVDFPKPLDYALSQRLIEVPGVEGTVALDRDETRWLFTPAKPWHAGSFRLIAHAALEDISGNRLDRPFDVDLLNNPLPERMVNDTVPVPFTVR